MTTAELIKAARERGLVIYGAGYVAGLFRTALEERGLAGYVRMCLTTGCPEEAYWHGIPLRRWDPAAAGQLSEKCKAPLICLAVHEVLRDEILRGPLAGYADRCEWIYPNLFELAFGETLYTREFSPGEIVGRQRHGDGWIALRYVLAKSVADGKPAEDSAEGSLYVKALSHFSGRETALYRRGRFLDLLAGYSRHGFDRAFPLLLDTELRVIDGLHRLAAALVFGTETVPCRIVGSSMIYDRFFDDRVRLVSSEWDRAGLSRKEKELLCAAQRALLEIAGEKKERKSIR